MTLDITILGCGSSAGVPRVAQGWGHCDPNNPKNRRRRCALLVEKRAAQGSLHEPTRLLVDAGADLREQLIATNVHRLEALLLTHAHADHIHGLDDLRPLTMAMHRRIDIYLDPPTWGAVGKRFDYLFETPPGSNYPPLLIPHVFDYGWNFSHGGPAGEIEVQPFRLNHGDIDATRLSLRGLRLYARRQSCPARKHGVSGKSRSVDRRRLAPQASPEPSLGRARRWS